MKAKAIASPIRAINLESNFNDLNLMKAINNFDTNYGVQFSTYAVPIIMGEIKRYFRDDGTIKVSRSLKELNLILNLLPMELSFVDAQNIVKYYNEGNGEEKIFKRTPSAIGRDVILCHPPRVHETVQTIFETLK